MSATNDTSIPSYQDVSLDANSNTIPILENVYDVLQSNETGEAFHERMFAGMGSLLVNAASARHHCAVRTSLACVCMYACVSACMRLCGCV